VREVAEVPQSSASLCPKSATAPAADIRTEQRITHILIREILIDLDDATYEAVVTIHWSGGLHPELRVARGRTGRSPADRHPNPVEVIRNIGGQWPGYQVAVTMNRMRGKPADGQATVRVRELRERLGIAPFDPASKTEEMITEQPHPVRQCAKRPDTGKRWRDGPRENSESSFGMVESKRVVLHAHVACQSGCTARP